MVRIGVDIGGTKTVVGAVADDGTLLATERTPTPETPSATVAAIAHSIELLGQLPTVRGATFSGVGVGVAAWLDTEGEKIRHAPNLAWRDVPLTQMLRDTIPHPVTLLNDADAAAWGEFRYGAGSSAHSAMTLITVGTGIGGGIVMHGQLYRGTHGIAGEFGHQQVVPNGVLCGCGARGCWEQYASGTALERYIAERGRSMRGRDIADAAHHGDSDARDAFTYIAEWTGVGLAGIVMSYDPEVIVLGGGVTEVGELFIEPVHRAYRDALAERGRGEPYAELCIAELGNAAGLIGAAAVTG